MLVGRTRPAAPSLISAEDAGTRDRVRERSHLSCRRGEDGDRAGMRRVVRLRPPEDSGPAHHERGAPLGRVEVGRGRLGEG